MRKIISLIIISCVIFSANSISHAEENTRTAFGVSPAILDVILDPDHSVTKIVTLTNLSNAPQPIKTLKQSFTPKEKSDLSQTELSIYDASSWITMSDQDTDFILQPLQSKDITLNIKQPANATPGGHYATIIFQPMIPQELVSHESVFVYSRVAVLVFMQTKGDIVQQLEYSGSNLPPIYQGGKLNFDVTLKNTGNTHVQPSGKFNIYNDITGQLVTSVTFPASIILPQTSKSFPIEAQLPDFIGKYSIQAELTYGSDSTTLKSPLQSFFVFPYLFVIFVLLPLIFATFIIIKYRSRFILASKILIKNEATIKIASSGKSTETSLFKPRPKLKFKLNTGKKKTR